jgi:hypothetical protein
MARRRRKNKKKRRAPTPDMSFDDIVAAVQEGLLLPVILPCEALEVIYRARETGLEEKIGRSLNSERFTIAARMLVQYLACLACLVASIMVLGLWSILAVPIAVIVMSVTKSRAERAPAFSVPFLVLSLAPAIAVTLIAGTGSWSLTMGISATVALIFQRLVFRAASMEMMSLCLEDERLLAELIASGDLVLLNADALEDIAGEQQRREEPPSGQSAT